MLDHLMKVLEFITQYRNVPTIINGTPRTVNFDITNKTFPVPDQATGEELEVVGIQWYRNDPATGERVLGWKGLITTADLQARLEQATALVEATNEGMKHLEDSADRS
jgi:hypothetical protein|tara:strand:+ start:438 stop:761 length:324 start_codon:yes stop_codon:yes gene_type:complete